MNGVVFIRMVVSWTVVVFFVYGGFDAQAIVVNPTNQQIQQAVDRGMEAAQHRTPPNQLYWQFGGTHSFDSHGFLVTKLGGVTVMSAHFGLRHERPSDQEVERFLNGSDLQITVTIFGSMPQFAVESYMVLKQGNRFIKPARVRFDARGIRTAVWPEWPPYRANVIGFFPYGTFDPFARTLISVFPGDGGETSFELDFSAIP